MFRLSVLLSACLFVTLLIAGADKGQMRPGLARAVATGEQITMVERDFSAPVVAPPPMLADAGARDDLPDPMRPLAPARSVPPAPTNHETMEPNPVFTLSALPGLGRDDSSPSDLSAPEGDAAPPAPERLATDIEGLAATVWYVNTTALNVRQGPSTGDPVVGRLVNGEAVTVLGEPSGDWVRITIEGDGVEGWVASRLLSPY